MIQLCSILSNSILRLQIIAQIYQTATAWADKSIPLTKPPKIVMIAHLFRHGARNPLKNVFKEDWLEDNEGELTSTGMHQLYKLGKTIRYNYPDLFPEKYEASTMKVLSSATSRAVESALSHNLGLYDLGTGQMLETENPQLIEPPYAQGHESYEITSDHLKFALNKGYRPIPIYSNAENHDLLFFPGDFGKTCPHADKIVTDIRNTIKPALNYLVFNTSKKLKEAGYDSEEIFGTKNHSISNINKLYDYFRSLLFNTGEIPAKISKLYNEQKQVYTINFLTYYTKPEIVKLETHNFSQIVRKEFQKKVDNPNYKLNYLAFSGHDSNILPILIASGLSSFECKVAQYKNGERTPQNCLDSPEFSANVIWELSSTVDQETKKTEHLVRMLYNGKPLFDCSKNSSTEKVSKYQNYCTMEEFIEESRSLYELEEGLSSVCNGQTESNNAENEQLTLERSFRKRIV